MTKTMEVRRTLPPFTAVENTIIKSNLSNHAKLLYLVLASFADEDRQCHPSVSTVVKRSGMSRRIVFYSLSELEKRGCVDVTSRTGTSSVYKLTGFCSEVVQDVHEGGSAPVARGSAPAARGGVHRLHTEQEPSEQEPENEKAAAFVTVMKAWHTMYLAATGKKPLINEVTGSTLKRLIKQVGADAVLGAIEIYFTKPLWFTKDKSYDILHLQRHFNAIQGACSAKKPVGVKEYEEVMA